LGGRRRFEADVMGGREMSRVISVRINVPVRVENAARDGVPDTDSAAEVNRRSAR
jgi:hypothetical protein